jgi:hypothetical protein
MGLTTASDDVDGSIAMNEGKLACVAGPRGCVGDPA